MTTPDDRIVSLDATRGLAVMGILLINIISFSMPQSAYVNPLAWGGTAPADLAVWAINQLIFEGRMRGLFALLFGASAMLVMDRAEREGRSGPAAHVRRMLTLAPIGIAHMILVWDGDVLFHYALIGLVIWPLRRLEASALAALAIIVLAMNTLFWSFEFFGLWHAARTGQNVAAIYATLPGPGDPFVASDLAIYRGSYAGIVAHRWADLPSLPIQFLQMFGLETLGYMLLGMALYRSGFFTGGWTRSQIAALCRRCYAIAVPALVILTAWEIASGYDRAVLMGHMLGWAVPFRVVCAVGHLCLGALLLGGAGAVRDRIAAVGRMALSNYLTTSLVMTAVFYGYGGNLFGRVERAPVYLFVFAMWALMLAWSWPWLRHLRYGPAEWVWRYLVRGLATVELASADRRQDRIG